MASDKSWAARKVESWAVWRLDDDDKKKRASATIAQDPDADPDTDDESVAQRKAQRKAKRARQDELNRVRSGAKRRRAS